MSKPKIVNKKLNQETKEFIVEFDDESKYFVDMDLVDDEMFYDAWCWYKTIKAARKWTGG